MSHVVLAQMHIAGQVGYASPSSLSDVKGTGALSGVTISDLALKNNLVYGLKIGGYLPNSLSWHGMEFDGFYNEPDLKATRSQLRGGVSGFLVPRNRPGFA